MSIQNTDSVDLHIGQSLYPRLHTFLSKENAIKSNNCPLLLNESPAFLQLWACHCRTVGDPKCTQPAQYSFVARCRTVVGNSSILDFPDPGPEPASKLPYGSQLPA
jgi:hypothetical protein